MQSLLPTGFLLCFAAAVLAGAALGPSATAENVGNDHAVIARSVSAREGDFRHPQMLQEIATANGGNRAAGTPGTIVPRYVVDRLKDAGYLVRCEEFDPGSGHAGWTA